MNKLNAAWIVLIVVASLIAIGSLFYLFYRLYINRIYKGQRSWNEITSLSKMESPEKIVALASRPSIAPLVHDFLVHSANKPFTDRKMVTQLQFDEAPFCPINFLAEWNAMDTNSMHSVSTPRSSYHTVVGDSSTNDYFSVSSFNELNRSRSSIEPFSTTNDVHNRLYKKILYHSRVTFSKSLRKQATEVDIRQLDPINFSQNLSQV